MFFVSLNGGARVCVSEVAKSSPTRTQFPLEHWRNEITGFFPGTCEDNIALHMKGRRKNVRHRKLVMPEGICFVIMPFGKEFDTRYRNVYSPTIRETGLKPLRADSLSKPSPIMEDIWQLIKQADVLLADLTGRNVNVFYELGLAHAIRKPVVLVTDNVEEIPFDLRSLRLLVFTNQSKSAQMRQRLSQALRETVANPSAALPLAFVQPKRGLEIAYTLGGNSIESADFDLIVKALNGVPPKDVKQVTNNILKKLSQKQKYRMFAHVFYEGELKRFAPAEFVEGVQDRLAKLGDRFPPSLLAEMIYTVRTSGAAGAVSLLVETGFARNFVEANIIYDLVEWAVDETAMPQTD